VSFVSLPVELTDGRSAMVSFAADSGHRSSASSSHKLGENKERLWVMFSIGGGPEHAAFKPPD